MYLQITDKCNMSCSHCCFACAPGKGQHMPLSMFKTVLDECHKRILKEQKWIVIGGGEPTLHPNFWEIINYGLSYGPVWLATNGSNTDVSLTLARMAKRGILKAVLSIDRWHSPIDPKVVDAFKEGLYPHPYGHWNLNPQDNDWREIRTITTPYNAGTYVDGIESCPCRVAILKPDGNIFSCGCKDAPIIGTDEIGLFEEYKKVSFCGVCHKDTDYLNGKSYLEKGLNWL